MISHFKNLSGKAISYLVLYLAVKWTLLLGAGTWLYKSGLWKNEYLLILPAIALIIFGIKYKKGKISARQSQPD